MSDNIIECDLNFLSYERALELVPPEFERGFEWFQSLEGETFDKLPHHDKSLSKPDGITLSADRGIHAPSYKNLASLGNEKESYVLSIHSNSANPSGQYNYDDKEIIHRDDGTWILDYSAHIPSPGSRETEAGNKSLLNNLRDGVPVAVMIKQGNKGYRNYGLAYVERFDLQTNMFTLHGPVSAETANRSSYSIIPLDELSEEDISTLELADEGDQRKHVLAKQIRRERQAKFRQMLINAYEGSCAITGVNVDKVLQAAHIDPYRGRQSQRTDNGILLRSDLHLLYDSHLLTVLPQSNIIKTSSKLENTEYAQYNGKRLSLPKNRADRPNDYLLDQHAREFENIERAVA